MAGKNPARTLLELSGAEERAADPNGVAKLTELPLGTQMRLVVRGKEQITTARRFSCAIASRGSGFLLPGLGTTRPRSRQPGHRRLQPSR